jgi:uncharacterized protein (TIGR02145 family)
MREEILFLSVGNNSFLQIYKYFYPMPFSINRKDYTIELVVTIILFILIILFLFACEKLEFARVIKLDTGTVSDTTSNSAIITGEILDIGENEIIQYGHCWSNAENPTIALATKTELGTRKTRGSYNSTLTSLLSNTKYYVRAYATSSQGATYGSQLSFTTIPALPAVITTIVSAITSTTAQSGGNVTTDGGASVTARGVCWSTSQNPTTANSKVSSGTGTGQFACNLTGLTPSTTYYVRAYATNARGTAYGEQVSFTAGLNIILPTVTTTEVTLITSTSAQSGGNVTSDGGAPVTVRGVCWSTSPDPTIANSKTTNGIGTGLFTSNLTGLSPITEYYVRAYATNSKGTAYGNQENFTTSASGTNNPPVITSSAPTNIEEDTPYTYTLTATDSDPGDVLTYNVVQIPPWLSFSTPTNVLSGTPTNNNVGNHYVSLSVSDGKVTVYNNFIITVYQPTGTVNDYDGNTYNTVKIGNQWWMAENLKTTTLNDGTPIPLETDGIQWSWKTTPAYCWYDNDEVTYKNTYGALYNWFTVNTDKLCPVGWHVPGDAEWTELTDYLGGYSVAGGKLKEAGTAHWSDPNTGATNESGFSAVPGGRRYFTTGGFLNVLEMGWWWSATEYYAPSARIRFLSNNNAIIDWGDHEKVSGFSVRCVRD